MHIEYRRERQKVRDHWEDLDIGGWTILKWITRKFLFTVTTTNVLHVYSYHRIATCFGLLRPSSGKTHEVTKIVSILPVKIFTGVY
jgi:hypothetical protein